MTKLHYAVTSLVTYYVKTSNQDLKMKNKKNICQYISPNYITFEQLKDVISDSSYFTRKICLRLTPRQSLWPSANAKSSIEKSSIKLIAPWPRDFPKKHTSASRKVSFFCLQHFASVGSFFILLQTNNELTFRNVTGCNFWWKQK